jgi:hypothetical protein
VPFALNQKRIFDDSNKNINLAELQVLKLEKNLSPFLDF